MLGDFIDPIHSNTESGAVYTRVADWLESVGSDRDGRCRSDSHPHCLEDDLVARELTSSAPEIEKQGADGFLPPLTPNSDGYNTGLGLPSVIANSNRSAGSSELAVESPHYRTHNLVMNNILFRKLTSPLPKKVSVLLDAIRAPRESPSMSFEDVDEAMEWLFELEQGCKEDGVRNFMTEMIFPQLVSDSPYGLSAGLDISEGGLMSKHFISTNHYLPNVKVSQPRPSLLYGYSKTPNRAFTGPQYMAQSMLHPTNTVYAEATAQGLRFPFCAVEFKADGSENWVAENQCAGALSTSLNALEWLNSSLRREGVDEQVDNLCYGICACNNYAKLYIAWKEGSECRLQQVDAFWLSRPDELQSFREQVLNILDWGMGARLDQIESVSDIIFEETMAKKARAAKTRGPPSDSSATSNKK